MTDSVALLLKELRLPAFHRHYQSLWETAIEKNWSHTDYLAALCEYELSDRYQRRTQKWLREAKLAANKTFSALDQSGFSRPCNAALAKLQQDNDWAHHADNVLLIGPSGTGKTHIALGLGLAACHRGVPVRFITAAALWSTR